MGANSRTNALADIRRMDLAVDTGFAHAARDQLGDLGAEVENQDAIVLHRQSTTPASQSATPIKERLIE